MTSSLSPHVRQQIIGKLSDARNSLEDARAAAHVNDAFALQSYLDAAVKLVSVIRADLMVGS